MIGHYLLTLTPEQEDRVLTERLARAPGYIRLDGCRCLQGVVHDAQLLPDRHFHMEGKDIVPARHWPDGPPPWRTRVIGLRFDKLCVRFGEERVNRAIRNRILANQARRTLQPTRQLESVG